MRNYLKQLRIERGFKQIDVASRLRIGDNYYNMIENGLRQQNMSLDMLKKLALAFNIPIGELMEQEIRYKSAISH